MFVFIDFGVRIRRLFEGSVGLGFERWVRFEIW